MEKTQIGPADALGLPPITRIGSASASATQVSLVAWVARCSRPTCILGRSFFPVYTRVRLVNVEELPNASGLACACAMANAACTSAPRRWAASSLSFRRIVLTSGGPIQPGTRPRSAERIRCALRARVAQQCQEQHRQ